MMDGENDSDIIDRDMDDVLAIPENLSNLLVSPRKNQDKGCFIDQSMLSSVKKSSEEQKQSEQLSFSPELLHRSSEDGSHTVDGITQIDVLGRRHIQIHHHGTIALGTVCSINDLILNDTITSSHIPINGLDLLQLLACQPIYALDVQPLTNEIDEIINKSHIFLPQYSIHFIAVPDGVLGLEVTHISLQQALNIPPHSSIVHTSFTQGRGFCIDRYSYSALHNPDSSAASLLSVGDIVIAVNDISIVSMPAPTAAAILAQTKNRRFTILRVTAKKENTDAKTYVINQKSTSEGRKRYRSYLREETYPKYGQNQPSHIIMEDKAVETDVHIDTPDRNSGGSNNITDDITLIISRETKDIIDAYYDNTDAANEPLHKRWCAIRRTYLCHTLYKPVSDLYPAVLRQEIPFQDINTHPTSQNIYYNNVTKEYVEALKRQKFLEVIYAKDGSRELKNTLMQKFRRLEN